MSMPEIIKFLKIIIIYDFLWTGVCVVDEKEMFLNNFLTVTFGFF